MLPASAYLEMALAAAVEVFGAQSFALKDIEFRRALFLPDGEARTLQLILAPGRGWSGILSHLQSPWRRIGQSGKSWTLHATGEVSASTGRRRLCGGGRRRSRRSRLDAPSRSPARTYYRRLSESGIHYGPFFRSIPSCGDATEKCWAKFRCPKGRKLTLAAYQIHPAILDAGLQVSGLRLRLRRQQTANRPSSCRLT